MVRLSTGLAGSMLGNFGLLAMMNYGYIRVYTGDQPTSPNDIPTGTLIGRVTTDGLPFTVNSTSGGALGMQQIDAGLVSMVGTWKLTGLADGEAGWWRWTWNAFDDDDVSFFYPRMDGLVGESLLLADINITTSTDVEIDNFAVQFRG